MRGALTDTSVLAVVGRKYRVPCSRLMDVLRKAEPSSPCHSTSRGDQRRHQMDPIHHDRDRRTPGINAPSISALNIGKRVVFQAMLNAALQMDSVELSGAIQNALVVQSFASGSPVGLTAENVGMSGNEISQGQLDIDMFWTRCARNGVQLQYYYDGDKKGVVNHLAHDCGQKPWRNPMLNKKLLVKTSSPPSRSTSPKANMPSLSTPWTDAWCHAGRCWREILRHKFCWSQEDAVGS